MGEFDFGIVISSVPQILSCFGSTALLTAAIVACSIVLGSLLAWCKLSGNKAAYAIASFYTLIIRCTPTVILLFLCYYGLPKLFDPLGIYIDDMNIFWYCLIAFTLLNSASLSELMRSSYSAVDKGQAEAAAMAGLTGLQTLRRIILPQALYIAAPNIGNMLIGLIKEVSLAFTIGFVDMMGKTKLLISLRYGNHAIESYLALLFIYWVLTLIITRIEKITENRLGAGRARSAASD